MVCLIGLGLELLDLVVFCVGKREWIIVKGLGVCSLKVFKVEVVYAYRVMEGYEILD